MGVAVAVAVAGFVEAAAKVVYLKLAGSVVLEV